VFYIRKTTTIWFKIFIETLLVWGQRFLKFFLVLRILGNNAVMLVETAK